MHLEPWRFAAPPLRGGEGRARARGEALSVQRGVSARRLTLESYGPDKPCQTGIDNKARATNRRVEFIVE
jgi:outer membrane protein OmpA-like peptidoglycan-associated protein